MRDSRLVDEVRRWLERQANAPASIAVEPFDSMFGDFFAWNRDLDSATEEAKADPGLSLQHGGRVAVLQRLQGRVCYYLGPISHQGWDKSRDPIEMGATNDVEQACGLALAYLLREPLPKLRRQRWGRLPDGERNGLVWTE